MSTKKIKTLFQIIIVVSISSMAFYSVFQVLKNVIFTPQKEFGAADRAEDFVKREKLRWDKNKLIFPQEYFLPVTDQQSLIKNENYFLLEIMEDSDGTLEKCYLGSMKLMFLNYDHFIFYSEKGRKNSKLDIFSNLNSKKVMLQILDKTQFTKQAFIKNCKNWTYIRNLSDQKSNKYKSEKKKIQFPKNTCVSLSLQKYLTVTSHHATIIHVEENPQKGKIDLCGIKEGSSLIELQSCDGEMSSFLAISQSRQGKKKNDVKQNKEKSFDTQLDRPHFLSGWKK